MLGNWVGGESINHGFVITLSPGATYLLLALMPGSFEHPIDLQAKLKEIREQFTAIKALWCGYNEYELMMFSAFCRSQLEATQWMTDWIEKLASECK